MNTTAIMDEAKEDQLMKPGEQLAAIRQQKNLSIDYVASKLHLRVRLVELLEQDEYESMPEPVFIQGYFRAYAKLLEVDPEPFLTQFTALYSPARKTDKALWQSRRESNKAEHVIRWVTSLFAVGVLIAVSIWWHKNKDSEQIFPAQTSSQNERLLGKDDTEIRLTDLSKMRSLLSSNHQISEMERASE